MAVINVGRDTLIKGLWLNIRKYIHEEVVSWYQCHNVECFNIVVAIFEWMSECRMNPERLSPVQLILASAEKSRLWIERVLFMWFNKKWQLCYTYHVGGPLESKRNTSTCFGFQYIPNFLHIGYWFRHVKTVFWHCAIPI